MVLEKVQKEELYNTVWPLVDSLTDNQAKTIRARYQENKTFKEIAEAQGVSIEMARQRERQGLRELRKPSKSKLLRPFLPEDNRIYSMGLRAVSYTHLFPAFTAVICLMHPECCSLM